MRFGRLLTLLFLTTAAAAACTDGGGHPDGVTAPSQPRFSYQVIEDGTYSSYSRDVTFRMYEGYAEMDGQAVTLEQRYHEHHQWQGHDYDGTITFPSPDNTFGSGSPEAIDVARIYTTPDGHTTVYDRSGALIPTSDAEVDAMHATAEAEAAFAASDFPDTGFASASTSSTGAAGRAPRDRREPVDRVLITPAGSVRTLARLRAANVERAGAGGLLLFSRREGDSEVRETWDSALGAVTEVLIMGDDGETMRTVHRFVREAGILALAEEQTVMLDSRGAMIGKFTLQFRNHTLR